MSFLLPAAVLMLMVSVGMSLDLRSLVGNWKRLTWRVWVRLLLTTFLLPPLIALGLGHVLPIGLPSTAGLFLVAVAPGAPLMTRNLARKGFDLHMAASYQVWGALMIPVMIPLLVATAGSLYQRDIWIPPRVLLAVIVRQQFLPLLAGMALMRLAPAFSTRARRVLNILGNAILTVALIALLWKLGPALKESSPWLFVAALVLAIGCLAVSRALLGTGTPGVQTLVISNVNRHVGLALLVSGQFLQHKTALPAIACYALAAPLVMAVYARFARRKDPSAISLSEEPRA
jgi:bile acid:Na+ symporter, BASS family